MPAFARSSRPLLVLSFTALLGACENTQPTLDGGSAERDTGGALPDGGDTMRDSGAVCGAELDTCTAPSDCCSGLYCGRNGWCETRACAEGGASCASGDDCCSDVCVAGRCAARGCIRDRDPEMTCMSDAVCCSGHCNSLFRYCQATACVGDGTTCTANAECCSERCRIVSGTTGTCTSSCASMNGTCEVNIDCCFGTCIEGFCR